MKSVLAHIPTSYISDVELPGYIPVTELSNGSRIPVIISNTDEFDNFEEYMCRLTVAQPVISADKQFINLFCNIKTDKPITIPINSYISVHK